MARLHCLPNAHMMRGRLQPMKFPVQQDDGRRTILAEHNFIAPGCWGISSTDFFLAIIECDGLPVDTDRRTINRIIGEIRQAFACPLEYQNVVMPMSGA